MIKFFSRNYWLLLAIVVILSYGQTLLMFPWQDDHTLFFKLENITGKAGYFGAGPFGEGAYKYIVTPYILIYKLFGLNVIAYYAFALLFYFLAAFVIYKVFTEVISPKAGKIAGFLFAAGYVASDGFVRIFNSVSTSIGIIASILLFWTYWRFYKKGKYLWYLLAIAFYFFAVEFARIRTHYLVAVVLALEIIFFAFKKPIWSVIKSLVRLSPFLYLFYVYFLKAADARSSQIGTFFKAISAGQFYKTYSFLSGVANIWLPNNALSLLASQRSTFLVYCALIAFFGFAIYLCYRNKKRLKIVVPSNVILGVVWAFVSKSIFTVPNLSLQPVDFFLVFIGGEVILFSIFIIPILRDESKKLYLFLVVWFVASLASYSIYEPNLTFIQFHRYLAHSFIALGGILALVAYKNKKVFVLVVAWGIINLISAINYQHLIVTTRSIPVVNFYSELKKYAPSAKKGDIFYFDVADNARGTFADAFSVASMPEETAIAWQYGLDRYDIRRVVSFDNLKKLLDEGSFTDINHNDVEIGTVHAFYYDSSGLKDISGELTGRLAKKGVVTQMKAMVSVQNGATIVTFASPISGITPNTVNFRMSAEPLPISAMTFPYVTDKLLTNNSVATNSDLRKLAFNYLVQKTSLRNHTKVDTNNSWKEDIASNLADGLTSTSWRADRVLWKKQGAIATFDLGTQILSDKVVWVNGNTMNSPTEIEIEVSLDGKKWTKVATWVGTKKISGGDLQTINFKATKFRYFKFRVLSTLSSDSASVAEVWAVPMAFSQLDVSQAELFLAQPFGYIPNSESYINTLSQMNYLGKVQYSWIGDKTGNWQTLETSQIQVRFDGRSKEYSVFVPAGGTAIRSIKLDSVQVPGSLLVSPEVKITPEY